VLDVAIRRPDGSTAIDLGARATPPLPVFPALRDVLPDGLRRGSTVGVTGSVSLLLALLGAASAQGGWCALVGFPRISAEAAAEYGIELTRLALVPAPGTGWVTAVGALVDALDVVAVRPPARLVPGDVRRLSARARSRDAVLMPFGDWPGADVRLTAADGQWHGIGQGSGRLRFCRVSVRAEGRGPHARPRSATLDLPADGGGVREAARLVEPVPLAG
jgi:hypothetical protein